MSFELKKYKLAEIADVQTGPFGSQLHKDDYVPHGTPIITVEHLGENFIIHENTPKVSNDDALRLSKYSLCEGDIVFSRVGSVDRRAYVSKKEHGWLFSGRCLRVRVNKKDKIDPKYLSYYFGLESFREYVRSIAVGATMPSLNTKIMSSLEIQAPELNVQVAISKLLSSLDNKIELNNAINKNLEEMAQALFKRWFVDFEFPNENGEPYKSSGGEFEESELGLIPKGWKVKKISEVTNIVRGASPRPIQDYIDSKGMPWIKISDATEANSKFIVKTKEFIKKAGISKSRKINPGTLILSNSATPGIPMFVLIEACVHDGWLIFKDFFGVSKEFLYYFLLREREGIVSLSNGSVFRNLKTDILKNYKIIIPKDSVLMQADVIFKSINESIASRIYQNEQLAELRDTLLPKLMSGEIRVPVEQDHSVPDLPMVAERSANYQP
ncbi:restriction endonuclease subunit S [Paenibacillus barengoltzii]|uniref:restriction endonuclease subunit S n=1 Tax=Paenibacillus barengoltzii TaxID=343517 RepID=UPI003F88BD79